MALVLRGQVIPVTVNSECPMTQEEASLIMGSAPYQYHAINLLVSGYIIHLSDLLYIFEEDLGGEDMLVWEAYVEAIWHGYIAKTVDPETALYEAYDSFVGLGPEYLPDYVRIGKDFTEILTTLYKNMLPGIRAQGFVPVRIFPTRPTSDYEMIMVVIECIDQNYPHLPQLMSEGFVTTCTSFQSPTSSLGRGLTMTA